MNALKKRKGVCAIDRGGCTKEFPIVIACVYGSDYGKFRRTASGMREIAKKEKRLYANKRGLKSSDIQKPSIQKEIGNFIFKEHPINHIILINRGEYNKLKQRYKGQPNWQKKLESIFWARAILEFRKKHGALPESLILHVNYKNPKDQINMEADINELLAHKYNELIDPYSRDKRDDGVVVADHLCGHIRRHPELKKKAKVIRASDLNQECKKKFGF